MSTNPYSDPNYQNPYSIQQPSGDMIARPDGYSKQIPIVGVFHIIQAGMELLMCAMLFFLSFAMTAAANDPKFQQANANKGVAPETLVTIFVCMSVGVAIICLLRFTAGIMTLFKRGRIFTLVVSLIGLLTAATVYCSLTSIGVAVYSLVILIQPSVVEAYRQRNA
jgi:uncharacterized membrane protein